MHRCGKCVNESMLVEVFNHDPMVKIIDFFLDNRLYDYSKEDVSEGTALSRATVFSYFKKLEDMNAVKVSRTIGKKKLYKLNAKNVIVKKLSELDQHFVKAGSMEKAFINRQTIPVE